MWGALAQILGVFGIGEICLGRWRTLLLAYVAPLAGTLSDRIGERWILTCGLALQGAGLAFVALEAGTHTAYTSLAAGLVAAGIGISMALPTVQTSILGAVPPAGIGKAAGSSNTFRQLGGAIAVIVESSRTSWSSAMHTSRSATPEVRTRVNAR